MTFDNVVVIGSGHAGVQAAASLRQEGYEGNLTLVGGEGVLPYQRPPLSKGYVTDGKITPLRPDGFYEKNSIELISDAAAIEIRCQDNTVLLDGGRTLEFDQLILATGARNRALSIPGIALQGVHDLRSLADAERIRSALAQASRVAIIGGGFIGLEMASAATSLGLEVVVLEASDRLMARSVSSPMSGRFADIHRGNGVDIKLNTVAARIVGSDSGNVAGVETLDGQVVSADLVVVAVGVLPETALAEGAGLTVANGIVVDAQLATSQPNIAAIGDCAAFPHRLADGTICLESIQNAMDQARFLARRLLGKDESYDAVPWFWSDQFKHKLQIAGLPNSADRNEVKESAGGDISVWSYKQGQLIGVETIDSPSDHMKARRLLVCD